MRNEDYGRELLVTVTLICAALTSVFSAFEAAPPVAKAGAQSRVEQLAPVRVIGTPFVLNTDPGAR